LSLFSGSAPWLGIKKIFGETPETIAIDINNALRYYKTNDKEFREQRNRKIIQTGSDTKSPKNYTTNCPSKARNIRCSRGIAGLAHTSIKSPRKVGWEKKRTAQHTH
jgi:hypothetical protein